MARGIDFQYIEYIVNHYHNGFLSVEMRRLQKTMVKPNKPQNPKHPKNLVLPSLLCTLVGVLVALSDDVASNAWKTPSFND